MNLALNEIEEPVHLRFAIPMTDEELLRFCAENENLRVERGANGELRLMSPTGTDGGNTELDIATEVNIWARQDGRGRALGSNSGVRLPDSAVLAADAGWVSWERYNASPVQSGFRRFVPQFVVEVRSEADRLPDVRAKMAEWMGYGVELGWLVDPSRKTVEIYRPGQDMEEQQGHSTVYGEGSVDGFVLELWKIWG